MGGKALSIKAKKLNREEYEIFLSFLLSELKQRLKDTVILEIPYYSEKTSFSDVDIIVSKQANITDNIKKAFLELGSKECKIRKDMLFFELNGVQIDVMLYDKEAVKFARDFYSYNDLISLMFKKICSASKLFLYPHGLFYKHKDIKGHDKSILVTRDFDNALQLFEYKPEVFRQGFKNFEDMYSFIITSPLFYPWKFNKKYFSKIDKASYESRPVFRFMVDKINSNEDRKERTEDAMLKKALSCFPDFKERIDNFIENESDKEKAKIIFNGFLVTELTGLVGVELGDFMTHMRKILAAKHSNEYKLIIELGSVQIKKLILEEFKKYER